MRSHQTDKIYIGSTTQALSERFRNHKLNLLRYNENKYHYVTSFEIAKYEDCYIELIKICPCTNKEELHKIEGEEIRNHSNTVNKVIPARSKKEHYNDNKETIKLMATEYRQQHSEEINYKFKEYYYANQEHRIQNSKTYAILNRDKLKEQQKFA